MSYFAYRDGALHVEQVAIGEIATTIGTPFYCYSTAALRDDVVPRWRSRRACTRARQRSRKAFAARPGPGAGAALERTC